MGMDVSELFLKLDSLSRAVRARNWVAASLVLADLVKAGLEWWAQRQATDEPVMAMAAPCNLDDLDAVADYLEAQSGQRAMLVAGFAFPWQMVLPVIVDLILKVLQQGSK